MLAEEDLSAGAMEPLIVLDDDLCCLPDDERNSSGVLALLTAENALAKCTGAGEDALTETVFQGPFLWHHPILRVHSRGGCAF